MHPFFLSIINADAPIHMLTDITNAVYVFDGNSLTAGQGGTPYPSQFATLSPFVNNGTFSNLGVGGQQTSQMISDFNSQVLPLYNADRTCFYIVNEVGNDVYYNGDVGLAMSRYWQLCDMAKSAGFKVGIIGLADRSLTYYGTNTPIGDNEEQYRAKLTESDNFIRQNWINHGDFYVDLKATSELSNAWNTTYFTDRVHNTTAGYAVWAREVRLALLDYCNLL